MTVKHQLTIRLSKDVSRVLHVMNLPTKPVFTNDQLYQLFDKFGAIREIREGTDVSTKGQVFVVYEDIYDAKKAFDSLQGLVVGKGKCLSIAYHSQERLKRNQCKEGAKERKEH